MSEVPFDPEAVIDAMAPMLGLDPAAFNRAAVAENLRLVARMARLVLDPPIDDHAEPASVFVPRAVTGRESSR